MGIWRKLVLSRWDPAFLTILIGPQEITVEEFSYDHPRFQEQAALGEGDYIHPRD
jgi:hypothetical protein